MEKSISQQMEDLHVQARVAQTEGIMENWGAAKNELDTLYEMADVVEDDIAKHPAMPQREKDALHREVENSVWGAHLPISIAIKLNGKLGDGTYNPARWVRKI